MPGLKCCTHFASANTGRLGTSITSYLWCFAIFLLLVAHHTFDGKKTTYRGCINTAKVLRLIPCALSVRGPRTMCRVARNRPPLNTSAASPSCTARQSCGMLTCWEMVYTAWYKLLMDTAWNQPSCVFHLLPQTHTLCTVPLRSSMYKPAAGSGGGTSTAASLPSDRYMAGYNAVCRKGQVCANTFKQH